MQNEINKPPDWGQDPLSKFIKDAWHNTYATFANLKPQYTHLEAIHSAYQKIKDNLINTPEWFASFFLMRAHASYLGGVQLSFSGQIPEAYMVLRGCLENRLLSATTSITLLCAMTSLTLKIFTKVYISLS